MSEVTKKVIIELEPITVEVKVDEKLSDVEVLEIAKKQLPSIIENKFPGYSYGVCDGNVLSMSDAIEGKIVKDKKLGYGIIIKKSKVNINVVFSGRRVLYGKPASFLNVDDENISPESIMWEKHDKADTKTWYEGDVGFLVFTKENSVIPVVVTKCVNDKYTLYIIGDPKGSHFKGITEAQMASLFFDVKEDAKKTLKMRTGKK